MRIKKKDLLKGEPFNGEKIGVKTSSEIFKTLYSQPESSVVRELYSNSIDSGCKRIDIVNKNGRFSFKDDGCGMNLKTLKESFLACGESDKAYDNSKNGLFGIGAQSPFALVDSYRVLTCDGEEAVEALMTETGAEIRVVDIIERGTTVSFNRELDEKNFISLLRTSDKEIYLNGKKIDNLHDGKLIARDGNNELWCVGGDLHSWFYSAVMVGNVPYPEKIPEDSFILAIERTDICDVEFSPSKEMEFPDKNPQEFVFTSKDYEEVESDLSETDYYRYRVRFEDPYFIDLQSDFDDWDALVIYNPKHENLMNYDIGRSWISTSCKKLKHPWNKVFGDPIPLEEIDRKVLIYREGRYMNADKKESSGIRYYAKSRFLPEGGNGFFLDMIISDEDLDLTLVEGVEDYFSETVSRYGLDGSLYEIDRGAVSLTEEAKKNSYCRSFVKSHAPETLGFLWFDSYEYLEPRQMGKELEPWAKKVYEEHLTVEEKIIIDIVRSNRVSDSFIKASWKRFRNPSLLEMFSWKKFDLNTVERKMPFSTVDVDDMVFPKYEEMIGKKIDEEVKRWKKNSD